MYRPYCIQLIDLTYMTLLSLNTVYPKSLDQGRHQRAGKWTRAYPWCSKNRALGWNKEIKGRQNPAQILLAIRDSTFYLPYLKSWGRPWPSTIHKLSYKMNQDFLDTLYRSKQNKIQISSLSKPRTNCTLERSNRTIWEYI